MACISEAYNIFDTKSINNSSNIKPVTYGYIYATSNPKITSAHPSYAASILKNDEGRLYIDDNWFGKFILPLTIKNNDIIEISKYRWGRINIF